MIKEYNYPDPKREQACFYFQGSLREDGTQIQMTGTHSESRPEPIQRQTATETSTGFHLEGKRMSFVNR